MPSYTPTLLLVTYAQPQGHSLIVSSSTIPATVPAAFSKRWLSGILVVLGLLSLPGMVTTIQRDQSYLTVPVAWLIFAFYLYRAPKLGFALANRRRSFGVGLVLAGLVCFSLGAFFLIHKVSWLGLLLATTGFVQLTWALMPWTRVLAITSLLWVAWPWPGGIYERLEGWIHRQGMQTAVGFMDLVGIPVFSEGWVLQLRPRALDTAIWMNGPDGLIGILLVAVFSVVLLRRTLVPSLLTVLCVPVLAWLAEISKILLWYWFFSAWAIDLSSGWPLIGLRCGVFACVVAMIWLINYGVHWALLPVLSDPNARTNLTMHSLYNVVTLWPLQVSLTAQQADSEYLGDDDEDDEAQSKKSKHLAVRRLPNAEMTKRALDPWISLPLKRWTWGLSGVAILLSVAALLAPRPTSLALPQFDEGAVQSVLGSQEAIAGIDLSADFTKVQVTKTDDGQQYLVSWNFASRSGPVTLLSRFPSGSTSAMWTMPPGMQAVGVPQPMQVNDLQMYENSFSGQMGATAVAWFAAMTPDGVSVAEPGLGFRLKARLANSLLGRWLSLSNDRLMYETALIVEAPTAFSERQKREYRQSFAELSRRIADKLREVSP